ncbi:hypothetical protein AGABI1DRAFT_135347 [Agaricus bisporus var. burnettii JB137-S8]|uniref:Uncharacterized protein n=1 Tax=Agaricus bisporus var. burnettii (strain JB137-S8 / ATCC MYA-4627 / FGSC 10392) TaxID=597362 RepID=K5XFR5_AGABU|nr:uncharacterized protein AGABI1DRAFT_135347 [Agaricus bisporus var. burnettii JB137-S8]EKM73210.1 hypothetical protein AGABI1DRAFT_135347 [Agaricus bisporus var. burnettii JB137-S8]
MPSIKDPKFRHCRRCPGSPLLRECHHSRKARLADKLINTGIMHETSSEVTASQAPIPVLELPQLVSNTQLTPQQLPRNVLDGRSAL